MAPRKTTPPVLEGYHGIKKATELLGLSDPADPTDTAGQKWLRDGVNLKGWPHQRMAGRLVLSDSDLAAFAGMHRNPAVRPGRRSRKRAATRPSTPAAESSPAAA